MAAASKRADARANERQRSLTIVVARLDVAIARSAYARSRLLAAILFNFYRLFTNFFACATLRI